MKTQKKPSLAVAVPLVALSLALSLLVSAAPPAFMDPLQVLPAGALFVVSAGNPGRVMTNALAFTRKAGLNELEAPLAMVLEALEGRGDLPDDLVDLAARIDWSRRVVIAVYPIDGGARPGFLAYIPASNPRLVQEAIRQASEKAGEQASTSLALSGYVMMAMGMEAPTDLDFKRLELTRLAAYPASSLATWVDIEAGKEYVTLLTQGLSSIFGPRSPGGKDFLWDEGFDQAWEDDEAWDGEWDGDWDWDAEDWDIDDPDLDAEDWSAEYWSNDWVDTPAGGTASGWSGLVGLDSLGSLMDGAEGVLDGLGDIFKDIRSVDFGVVIEADRVWIRSGLIAAPGGILHRMSAEAASGQLPLPYLPYLEMDALVSMTWSTKADWAVGMLETLYATMLPHEALLRKAMDAMKASMASTGLNGAVTFDLRLSDELASAIRTGSPSGDEALPVLGRGLSFDVAGVMQLTDRQGFRDALRESMALVEDPGYKTILKDNKLELLANRRVGIMDGLPFDRYEYGIRSTDEGSMADGVLEIFNAMAGPLLAPVYVYRGDKAYLGFGKPETLRPLIGRDRAARPLQTAPRFRALRGGAPADTRGLVYLSTGTLMRRIMQVLPEEKGILPFGYGDLYGVLGWFSASPGQLGFGIGLGAEDVKAFRSLPD
jgi:hypothetical protein